MKLPKLKKTKKVGIILNLGEGYMLELPLDSSLIKNLPKLTDLAMDRESGFEDQNKLQIELQHLSDILLELESEKKDSRF